MFFDFIHYYLPPITPLYVHVTIDLAYVQFCSRGARMAFAMSPYLAISDVVFSGHHLSEGPCRMYYAEIWTVNTHTSGIPTFTNVQAASLHPFDAMHPCCAKSIELAAVSMRLEDPAPFILLCQHAAGGNGHCACTTPPHCSHELRCTRVGGRPRLGDCSNNIRPAQHGVKPMVHSRHRH